MVQSGFPIRLILTSLFALGGPAGLCLAQDDDAPPRMNEAKTEKSGSFSSAFGKMFGRKDDAATGDSQPKSSESSKDRPAFGSSVPGKPSFGFAREKTIPAQTAGNRGGGIFVPLRSFTNRVFRTGEEQGLSSVSVEAQEEYESNITNLENMARNRAEASLNQADSEDETNPTLDKSVGSPMETSEGSEVGSALKSNSSATTPAPKTSVEPFANSRPKQSSSRGSSPTETQRSTSLPPPPPLASSMSANQSKTAPAPISNSNNLQYSGARTNATRPAPTPSLTNNLPSLEDKSTSRKTPVGITGIVESAELPETRNTKPTNLVDLSDDANIPIPTTVTRSRSSSTKTNSNVETQPSNETNAAETKTSSRTQSDEPSVLRNPVPEIKSQQQPIAKPTATPNPSQTSNALPATPNVSLGTRGMPQEQSSSDARSNTGATTSSLLELKQPGISINIAGPNAMVVGQETVYELIAKNHGTSNLNGLIVRVSLPNNVVIGNSVATSGATQPDREDGDNALLWEVESIAAGQTQSLKLPIKTASPEHFAMNVEWTALPQSQSLQVKVHEPKLDLALEGPAEAEYGVPLKYRLRIKNPGNAVAKAVEVKLAAESFGSNQSSVGDIAPGAERIIDVELLFEQGGVIPILASAVSSVSNVQSQSQIEVRVRQAKLVATWAGSNSYFQGSVGDYQITLNNTGDAAINQAKCAVSIPQGAEPLSMPPGSVRRGNSVQWDVKKLMPGESVSVPLRFTFSQLGQTELTLTAESKNAGSVVARHAITVDAVEDLKLAVVPPVAPAPVDQPVAYEIEIHNRGTKAAKNVAVLAQFSEGVEPVKVEGQTGQIVPGQVVFESIPSIGPNERITLKVFAQANSSGIHRFRAEVKGSSGEVDLVQEGSTRFMASGVQPQLRR